MSQRHFVQNDQTMLVTTVTLNRAPVFAHAANAREAIDCLYRVQQLHPFFLFSFVIMPDHCHFLLRVPAPGKISTIMSAYKGGLTFDLGIKKLWQPRFHIRLVEDANAALAYIHANPVRRELSETPETYPWSSASGTWDIVPLDV